MRQLCPATSIVDVDVVTHGYWRERSSCPASGSELLEQLTSRGAAGFESWLLAERRRVAAASEAILHEAAVGRAVARRRSTAPSTSAARRLR